MASKITVRPTTKEDLNDVIAMIQELADFEKMPEGPKLKLEDLIRDGSFDSSKQTPLFYSFVAEDISVDRPLTRNLVGYSLTFFTYSTWEGKSLLMEDLYVKPEYRKNGVGKLLIKEVAKFAKESGCCRMDFHVLDWNPATTFYDDLGATNLTKLEGWQFYRFDKEGIDKLIQ